MSAFSKSVRHDMGFALELAQRGGKSPHARPLSGFGEAGVLEVIEDHHGDTYRAVYTVKLKNALFVLHDFKKKSKSGISTPKHEIDLIKDRLKRAEEDYTLKYGTKAKDKAR